MIFDDEFVTSDKFIGDTIKSWKDYVECKFTNSLNKFHLNMEVWFDEDEFCSDC